jgi:pyridoxine 5-phosphate synthase
MARLGVNIDHVATVRQARQTDEPDPVWAAVEAELGGADGITIHLREDRRHIHDRDLELLRHTVGVKLNLEMSIDPKIVRIAQQAGPDQCTLVPERREEITTEGGLDVIKFRKRVGQAVAQLHKARCIVSGFIEPTEDQIKACADLGFDAVELWTGGFANARSLRAEQKALNDLAKGIELGLNLGLIVHGGHGLTYRNIEPLACMPGFTEFNIGHSIVARAIFVGLREAVRQMKELLIRFEPSQV